MKKCYKIRLTEMEFRAYHGCYDLEQKVGNRFAVRLEIGAVVDDPQRDDVTQLVNYLSVFECVEAQMKITQRTIEAVANNINRALLERFELIQSVECEVAKIAPPLGGKIARVSVILTDER